MNRTRLKFYIWFLLTIGLTLVANAIWLHSIELSSVFGNYINIQGLNIPIQDYTFPIYDLRRILSICLIGGIALSGILIPEINGRLQQCWQQLPKWVHYAIGLFFLIGITSSLLAQFPRYAFLEVGQFALLFFTTFVIAALTQQFFQNRWEWLYSIIAISLILLCITHFYLASEWISKLAKIAKSPLYLKELSDKTITRNTAFPGFSNIRFLTQAISWTWPLVVLPLLANFKNKKHYIAWAIPTIILASLWWAISFNNDSRALMIEWVIISIIAITLFRKLGLHWLKWQVITAVLGFILLASINHHIASLQNQITNPPPSVKVKSLNPSANNPSNMTKADSQSNASDSNSSQSSGMSQHYRLYLYYVALKMIAHNPALGVAPLHYGYAAWSYLVGRNNTSLVAHPHNAWLYIAGGWGIVAMILLFALFIRGLRAIVTKSIQNHRYSNNAATRLCVSASFGAAMIHALFSGIIIMPLSQTLMVFIAGWLIGLHLTNQPKTSPIQLKFWLATVAIVLVAAGLVIYGIYPMWGNWSQNIFNYYYQMHQPPAPNYWGQGFIQFWPHK